MNHQYVVNFSFGKSSSKSYRRAVRLIKSFNSYIDEGEEQRPRHTIKESVSVQNAEDVLENLMALVSLTINWKSSNLKINGYESNNFYQLHTDICSVAKCQASREGHPLEDDYCRGMSLPSDPPVVFGCRFADAVRRSLDRPDNIEYQEPGYQAANATPWWRYTADTESEDVFVVQKELVTHALTNSVNDHPCCSCRFYDQSRVISDAANLPDTVELANSDDFAIAEYDDIGKVKRKIVRKSQYAPLKIDLFGERDSHNNEAEPKRSVPKLTLKDVAINEDIIDIVRETLILPITHPDYFSSLNAGISHGVLLHGPPGNGKTLLAEAVAGEAKTHFIRLDGPEILSPWLGMSESNIRDAFAEAVKHAPTVLFIDEIDSIAPARSAGMQQHNNQIVAQLLTLLDGNEESVWIFGSTNRIEAIDPAILRPGRFDQHIFIDRPTVSSIHKILNLNLDSTRLAVEIDIAQLASRLDGLTGAEVVSTCKLAKQNAIKAAIELQVPPEDVQIARQHMDMAVARRTQS